MDQQNTDTTLPPLTTFTDQSVILKLLDFLTQLSANQNSQEARPEQVGLPAPHSR